MREAEQLPGSRSNKTGKRRNKKLLLLLMLFFISISILLFFNSSFSKITDIQVKGTVITERQTILNQSGVAGGDNYFRVEPEQISRRLEQIQTVKQAKVVKSFPGRIHIDIEEFPLVAYTLKDNGTMTALLSNGYEVPVGAGSIADKPILRGFDAYPDLKQSLCRTLAGIAETQMDDISEIVPDPTESYPDRIRLYTRSAYTVITTIGFLPHKLAYFGQIVEELRINDVDGGVITMLEADTHSFQAEPAPKP